MFRKDLANLLTNRPMTVHDIARLFQVPVKEVADDLAHLAKSLKHTDSKLVVTPARCHKCGFIFSEDKLTRPGKCPDCKGTWIAEPVIQVTGGG